MHLFVCEKTHLSYLWQHIRCERRMKIFSNHCKHVLSHSVEVGGAQEVYPLTYLSLMHMLGATGKISAIKATCAQHVLIMAQEEIYPIFANNEKEKRTTDFGH